MGNLQVKEDNNILNGSSMMWLGIAIGIIVVVGIVLAIVFTGGSGEGSEPCTSNEDCVCDRPGTCVCGDEGTCIYGDCVNDSDCTVRACEECKDFECTPFCGPTESCDENSNTCYVCDASITGSCADNDKQQYACEQGKCKGCKDYSNGYCLGYKCAQCRYDRGQTCQNIVSDYCNPLDGSSTTPQTEDDCKAGCSAEHMCCRLSSSTASAWTCNDCCYNSDCGEQEVCTGDPKSGWKWACQIARGDARCIDNNAIIDNGPDCED